MSVFPSSQSSQFHGNFKSHNNLTYCISWTIFFWGTSYSTCSTKKRREGRKRTFFHLLTVPVYSNLGLTNSKTKVLLRNIRLVSGLCFIIENSSFAKFSKTIINLTTFLNWKKYFIIAKTRTPKLQKKLSFWQ